MRYLTYLFFIVMTLILTGCAHHNKDYIKQSKTVNPIVVSNGVAVKSNQNYYPVPTPTSLTQTVVTMPPSLTPPGSNPQRFQPEPQQNKPLTRWTKTKNGQALEITENIKVAWVHVGKALRKTDYKILDQDPSMASYYVLDAKSTNNKITKITPIYRILLRADGENTQVELLNHNNQPAANAVSERILGALQQKLILRRIK